MSTITNDKHLDPLTIATNTAWLEYAKGTWSETDRRIFVEGFKAGSRYQYQLDHRYRRRRGSAMPDRGQGKEFY